MPRPCGAFGLLMSMNPMRCASASVWISVLPSFDTVEISATVGVDLSSPSGRFSYTGKVAVCSKVDCASGVPGLPGLPGCKEPARPLEPGALEPGRDEPAVDSAEDPAEEPKLEDPRVEPTTVCEPTAALAAGTAPKGTTTRASEIPAIFRLPAELKDFLPLDSTLLSCMERLTPICSYKLRITEQIFPRSFYRRFKTTWRSSELTAPSGSRFRSRS